MYLNNYSIIFRGSIQGLHHVFSFPVAHNSCARSQLFFCPKLKALTSPLRPTPLQCTLPETSPRTHRWYRCVKEPKYSLAALDASVKTRTSHSTPSAVTKTISAVSSTCCVRPSSHDLIRSRMPDSGNFPLAHQYQNTEPP